MAEPESQASDPQLREENEQIRAKYKKSLQELMHILKVNKSLKECLDQHSQQLNSAVQTQVSEVRRAHQQELQAYTQQIEEYKRMYQQEAALRKQGEALLQEVQVDLRTVQEQLPKEVRGEGTQERWRIGDCLELAREKQQLRQENQQLKENVNKLSLELMHEKEKARSELFSRDTELLRHKESESQKLKTIESKYQLLQSQLNNYKNVERYFQDQANILLDEESVYNSIREQITRINEDFSKYQLQSSNLLLRKREEDAQRNRRITELEGEVARLHMFEERAAIMERERDQCKGEINVLKEKVKQLELEKKQINEKVMVLEALTLTEKHRVQPGVSERIREFQTRVGLLLDEVPRESANKSVNAQVVVLKGYVQELSDLLRQAKKRQEKLTKKLEHYKEKISGAEAQFHQKLGEYQSRVRSYDTLVGKLYAALEERAKERGPEDLQREFNTAIGHYQGKMLQMSEEIVLLRTRAQELENTREEHNSHSATLQAENQTYKEIISELSIRINQLQAEAKKAKDVEEELKEKNRLVDALAREVNELTKKVHEQERISSNLSRQSIDTASLIEKVNYLEFQLGKVKPEAVRGLEGTVSAQQRQLAQYKQEVDRLYQQLRSQKTERKSSVADQYSLVAELQQRIATGEIRELTLQNQWHNKEAEYRNQLEALRLLNKTLSDHLAGKEELQENAERVADLQRLVADLDRRNQELVERFSSQASELNANLLALRTSNLSLRNELQTREDAINELKHQLFNAELRSQKERSLHGSMIRSGSGSAVRDSIREDKEKEERLLTIVMLGVEIQALRQRNGELEAMYHSDLDRYREALKQLEARQLELCQSLQYSNQGDAREETQVNNTLNSQKELIPLADNSSLFIQRKPLENTVRSQAWAGEGSMAQGSKVGSSVSILESPGRRRIISVKKIA